MPCPAALAEPQESQAASPDADVSICQTTILHWGEYSSGTLVTGFAGNRFRTFCLCRFLCFKVVEQGENAIALLHTLVKLKCYLRGLVPREPLRQAATHIARSAAQGGEYGLLIFLSLLRRDHKHAGVSPVAGEAHRRDRYFVKTGVAHFRAQDIG